MPTEVAPTALPAPVAALRQHGVAVWLDDLSRDLVASGGLAELVRSRGVVGVTTNPSIFAAAVAGTDAYTGQLALHAEAGHDADSALLALTTDDVRAACDVLAAVHRKEPGDGRVSIEVDPRLAHDTEGTLAAARQLWSTVGRPNLYIKIPATPEGLPAISAAIAEGISVNVTLIFSLARYDEVIESHLVGLERAHAAGVPLTGLASVASFFVSRVDTAVDAILDSMDQPPLDLRGSAAIANARLAYDRWLAVGRTERWRRLAAAGALPQRPLWASTSVKDPRYPDTRYVDQLVAPLTVNTMPPATLEAVADHAQVRGDTARDVEDARAVFARLAAAGIDLDAVTSRLEAEGVAAFQAAWERLLTTVDTTMKGSR